MDVINKLLDEARETCIPRNDKALADALHVMPSAVSNWRHARAYPDAVTCARLAEMTNKPLGKVIGIVGEARAISLTEKKVWKQLASACAALVLLAGYQAPAAAYQQFAVMPSLSIMLIASVALFTLWSRTGWHGSCRASA
jgi:transcriptional regulator with XRE-family HTH domain